MATARKPPQPATEPVTAPVLAPDDVFLQMLVATKDASLIAAQAKRSERAAREDAHNREIARLNAAYEAEEAALEEQVAQHDRITASCDLAIEHLVGATNVVPMKPKAEDPPIPEFMRRKPAEAAPAA